MYSVPPLYLSCSFSKHFPHYRHESYELMSTPVAFKVIPKHLTQPFKLPRVCSLVYLTSSHFCFLLTTKMWVFFVVVWFRVSSWQKVFLWQHMGHHRRRVILHTPLHCTPQCLALCCCRAERAEIKRKGRASHTGR